MAGNSNNPQDFMAQMLDLQQQYLQGVGQFFNPGQAEPEPESPFEAWWKQFPKSGQSEFDNMFRNLSQAGMSIMQNPFANLQQPFPTGNPGIDWFNQMNNQFESWIKASSPSQSIFDQMNEQFRQQLMAPFGMGFTPRMDNPFAAYNPAASLNSPVLQLLQNLYAPAERNVGEQLMETLQAYQNRVMEMNSVIAQIGIDSLAELQKSVADQEALSVQTLYENWMDISKTIFEEVKISERYQQLVEELTAASERLCKDFESYQETLTKNLGLVTREAYDSLHQEVEELRAQVSELVAGKSGQPSTTIDDIVDDFTVLKGIGAKFNEKLHQQGIKTMSQLASLSDDMLKTLDEDLQTKGRAFEQQWREQAEQFVNVMSGKK